MQLTMSSFIKRNIVVSVAPHGGKLVYRAYSKQEDISKYKKLKVKKRIYQIVNRLL